MILWVLCSPKQIETNTAEYGVSVSYLYVAVKYFVRKLFFYTVSKKLCYCFVVIFFVVSYSQVQSCLVPKVRNKVASEKYISNNNYMCIHIFKKYIAARNFIDPRGRIKSDLPL